MGSFKWSNQTREDAFQHYGAENPRLLKTRMYKKALIELWECESDHAFFSPLSGGYGQLTTGWLVLIHLPNGIDARAIKKYDDAYELWSSLWANQ